MRKANDPLITLYVLRQRFGILKRSDWLVWNMTTLKLPTREEMGNG